MILTDFRFLVENNNNPLLVFSSGGKVKYFNDSAELLVGMHLSHELFKLAVTYAPQNFGSRTVHIDLTYGTDTFCSITVFYENEDELCIYLYRKSHASFSKNWVLDGYSPTDINLLLEANIELFKMKYTNKLTLFTDYSLPKLQIQQNSFSLLLRSIFDQCLVATRVDITLKVKIGEMMIVDDKRYPILMLIVDADKKSDESNPVIEKLASKNHILAYIREYSLILDIPYIMSKD